MRQPIRIDRSVGSCLREASKSFRDDRINIPLAKRFLIAQTLSGSAEKFIFLQVGVGEYELGIGISGRPPTDSRRFI